MKYACVVKVQSIISDSRSVIVTYLNQSTNLCTLGVIKRGADNTRSQYDSPCSSLCTLVVSAVRGPGAAFLNVYIKTIVRKYKTFWLYLQPQMFVKVVPSCCSTYWSGKLVADHLQAAKTIL